MPLLLLAALRAGLTEEVIFIGYLFDRLRRLGWGWWTIILSTAALRGAYHAYQGIGPIIGNFAMGVVFGWCYRRWGRVMPLVIAHTVIDIVAFVGYPLAVALWPGLFGPVPTPTPTPRRPRRRRPDDMTFRSRYHGGIEVPRASRISEDPRRTRAGQAKASIGGQAHTRLRSP